MTKEIKTLERQAYEYACPAASTLYKQGFIKEEWLRDMLAQAYLAGASYSSNAQWNCVENNTNIPQGPRILCAKRNRYGWRMTICKFDGEDFFNENTDSYRPTHFMIIPPIMPSETKNE
ncbi:hypothetical protein [Duncaniella freteri]|uniref:hypothetical protein n=1 Tax=Duncaniella freteri TaxID=2530391 RepID=UPI0032B243DD